MLKKEQLREIEDVLGTFCREEPPARVRSKLQFVFRVEARAVVLAERRPAFGADLGWTEGPVAKFRYTKSRSEWSLYWRDRHGSWHEYDLLPPAKRLATLFVEVRRDPTGIFWG